MAGNQGIHQKENKVERVRLVGGIAGMIGTSPRRALASKIEEVNQKGWSVTQVIDDDTGNLLISILRTIILCVTLFIYTPANGYLLILERYKSDAKEDDHEEDGSTGSEHEWVSKLDTMSKTEMQTLIDEDHLMIINRFAKLNGQSEEEIKSRINDGTLKSVVIDNKIFLPSKQT